ncbi:rho guanine nucleotide exchange factor 18a isoform X2 [Gasterosteus aculeatus]
MTVAASKHSVQPGSSFNNTIPNSSPVQMDEVEGPRLRNVPEDAVSLAYSSNEPIDLEDSHYVALRAALEADLQNLEAQTWGVSVDQNYRMALTKEAVKRQEVIYELIQTEMHHVRTLKIFLYVYGHELKQSSLIEETRLEELFLVVEELLNCHQHFLDCLKLLKHQSHEEGSPHNYQITQLGNALIPQFSGALGERMMNLYSVFCSSHTEAVNLYKEQLQNNKKMQILIKVNAKVSEYERAARLREIALRLEQKSQGRLKNGVLLRREDLIQGNRTLMHEGPLTWKSSGRQKEIHAVLLSDMLLLLQEKDQKLVFAAVENKPPVISLQRLIVREVAHEDKAMYLISECNTSMPEMYEIHTRSREECISWMARIRQAVNCYSEEEVYLQLTTRLQQFQANLRMRDELIMQSLTEKQQLFAALYETITEQETPHKGLLLRGDTSDLQQGTTLLKGAIYEVENLQSILFTRIKDPDLLLGDSKTQEELLWEAETIGGADDEDASGSEDVPITSDPQLQESPGSDSPEQSAGDKVDAKTPNGKFTSSHCSEAEVLDKVILLAQRLYSLEAIVTQQDSQIELLQTFQTKSKQPARHYSSMLLEQEKQRNSEKQKEQLANLHKLQAQHREEQQRWEKEKEEHRVEIETLQARLQQREEDCQQWERKLVVEKEELEELKKGYQEDLERLRESTKSVDRDKERLNQERERLEQLQEKIKKIYPGNYDDPAQFKILSSHQTFRGSTVNGSGTLTPKRDLFPTRDSLEIPPKVPPRRQSICPPQAKTELPAHLISTTNKAQKPAVSVQQQIPTKLAVQSKEKGHKSRKSHSRTLSAASIDVSQVLPIRVTGKEGGSLRTKSSRNNNSSNSSRLRITQPGAFTPPVSAHSVKTSQSFSTYERDEAPPPPPPFPQDILAAVKDKVTFL